MRRRPGRSLTCKRPKRSGDGLPYGSIAAPSAAPLRQLGYSRPTWRHHALESQHSRGRKDISERAEKCSSSSLFKEPPGARFSSLGHATLSDPMPETSKEPQNVPRVQPLVWLLCTGSSVMTSFSKRLVVALLSKRRRFLCPSCQLKSPLAFPGKLTGSSEASVTYAFLMSSCVALLCTPNTL